MCKAIGAGRVGAGGASEDTVLAQIEDVSPFSPIQERTESKTHDGQQQMDIPFSSTWEQTREYSRQHLPPRRARRASCELNFFQTVEDVRLRKALKEEEIDFL